MQIFSYRTTMPFVDGLSPPTDRSVMPANNVPTILDVLNGHPYQIPGGGGDWSSGWGEDTEKSYKEKGDEYKRHVRDLDILNEMLSVSVPERELWKVKMPGGAKFFGSFNTATRFEETLREKGIKGISLSRIAANETSADNQVVIVSDSLSKCFKIEALNLIEGVKEIGSAFCIHPKYFLTCAHVIRSYDKNENPYLETEEFKKDIVVRLIQNGKWIDAKVIAVDAPKDIALLSADIDAPSFDLDVSEVLMGEDIFTIGSPHGYENNVSQGILGSTNRQVYIYDGAPDYMFVDLMIFSGNSGGPVIRSSNGKVIGVITLVVSDDAGDYGLNAGLPASYLEEFCCTHISGFESHSAEPAKGEEK